MMWTIDPSHSHIEFSVRHMMISNVRGRFENFTGTVDFNEYAPFDLKVEVAVETASINTRDAQRDGHLKSADFMLSEEHPTMNFRSTSVEKVSDDRFRLHGDLTIRGVTHPIVLDGEYSGIARSPWGTTSVGFTAHGRISRKEWGLVWNQTLETGGILVGDDVKIAIELELVKQETPSEVAA